ncbi:hypothetical protein CU254_27300 [Amycolatopsis sp. AA4]|uniref:hypothetical protein n=1 Tax=Actinomycetes TaxID=1760 RepID=UPI0001B56B71|nr:MULTISPECIES: hypothetical protein [Actinomycetes]ATY13724.1 hypothetical protein CU254_27300 [Amycolatopsis sp. AA4]EFL09706.1 predicted protein [Streptomyces sp. AA4]
MTEADAESLVDEIARLLELRTPLPTDCKELLNRFPGGVFRRIGIYSPVATEQAWIKYQRDLDEILTSTGQDNLLGWDLSGIAVDFISPMSR